MEISKPQLARLVLGYLNSEKCKTAFDEFLLNSQHLKSYAVFAENGKYFATRVGGLTLEDIIAEYSEIALTIQGRLEHTDYYEKNLELNLSKKLLYILEHSSRSSSPTLPKDLNATPIESLPGNSSNKPQKACIPDIGVVRNENRTTQIGCVSPTSSQKEDRKVSAVIDQHINMVRQETDKESGFDKFIAEMMGQKNEMSSEFPATNTGKSNTEKSQSNIFGQYPSTSKLSVEVPGDLGGSKQAGLLQTVPAYGNVSEHYHPTQQKNPFFLTNNSLLMVPSLGPSNFILVNNRQSGNVASLNNVLTEADIMDMPTVILDKGPPETSHIVTVPPRQPAIQPVQVLQDLQTIAVTQSQIIVTTNPQTTISSQKTTSNKSVKKVRTIAPKTDKVTIATTDGDFYAVFDEDKETMEIPDLQRSQGRPGLRKRSVRLSNMKNKVSSSPKKEKTPSPPKKIVETVEKKKKGVNKSLFKENKKLCSSSWDADLREFIVPKNDNSSDDKMDTSDDKLDETCDEELQKEAKLIEDAFRTPVKAQQKNDTEQDVTTVEKEAETVEIPEEKSHNTKVDNANIESENKETEEEATVLTEVYLRNCNGPPRIKKKCNQNENFDVELEFVEGFSSVKKGKDLMLETPMKSQFPKTPGKFEMSPFYKVIEEQLQDMDLLSLPTPSATIQTPNYPITPNVELNTPDHANRPTDYSTSSSYYQPSDTEQNKSFEDLMEQYKREEKNNKKKDEMKSENIKAVFNKNVIGKKNLSLIKKADTSSSDSESCSSDDKSDEVNDSDFTSSLKKDEPLKKRKVATPRSKKPMSQCDSAEKNKKKAEEFKNKPRKKNGRFEKIKVKPSPKREENENGDNENDITDDDLLALHLSTDEDSITKASNETVINRNKDEASSLKEPPTEEAKQLIQDLYERGIHLLPKLSQDKPLKPSSDNTQIKQTNLDPNALENLVVSSEDECNKTIEGITFSTKHHKSTDIINFVYDSSKRRRKKRFDLSRMTEKLECDLYSENQDAYIKRLITFGSSTTIMNYSPKKPETRRRRKSIKPEEKTKTELIKIKLKVETKENEMGKSSSKDAKSNDTSPAKSSTSKRRKSCTENKNDKDNETKVVGQRIVVFSPGKIDAATSGVVEKLNREDEEPPVEPKENDLMDFAVLGEPMEQEKEANKKSGEKRKLNSEAQVDVPPEKKTKTENEKQALLKKINVDLFLNQVHGVTRSS